MRALVWLSLALALGATSAGCVRAYHEPAVNEPHALVRVRVVRHAWAGPRLDEAVRLNGYGIAMPEAGPQPAIRAMRVRPELSDWRFATKFFHTEQRMRLETYQEQYACGSYTTTGYGGRSSTQTRSCSRTRTRQVWDNVDVTDAACRAAVRHVPMAGGAYLVQYEFFGHETCTARCFRQLPMPDGQFQLIPCGAHEPPPMTATRVPPPVGPATTPGRPPPSSGGEAQPVRRTGAATGLAAP